VDAVDHYAADELIWFGVFLCSSLSLMAVYIYDLGKVAISLEILNKRELLSPGERKEIRKHAEIDGLSRSDRGTAVVGQ